MFDVLVYNENTFQNVVYRNGVSKSEAKKTIKELRKAGKKCQLKSSKGEAQTVDIALPEQDEE